MRRLLLSTLWICVASAQTDGQSDKIVPAYSVAPSVFQIGQTPNVLLSLTNQNPNAAQQLQPGDVFTFTLGVPGGAFSAVGASAVVNSTSFRQADFTTSMGPNPNQVQITYLGPPVSFPVGDTIAVETTVTSSQVGAGAVSLQTPPDRYAAAPSQQLNISAVDFRWRPRVQLGPRARRDQAGRPDLRVRWGLRDCLVRAGPSARLAPSAPKVRPGLASRGPQVPKGRRDRPARSVRWERLA
jgi:hypothetical protein